MGVRVHEWVGLSVNENMGRKVDGQDKNMHMCMYVWEDCCVREGASEKELYPVLLIFMEITF